MTHRPNQDPGEIGCQSKPNLPSAKEHPYRAATATATSVEVFHGGGWTSALLRSVPHDIIPDATQLRVTLYAGEPWLDLEWSIANKTPDPWPEGGWLCFPLRADNPTFRLARLGSIVDPAKDLVRSSNDDLFCLNGGLTVEGADGGRTGICPIDAQLVSLERPGLWRYSRDFVAHKPDVFVGLFNNLYSTNFAQWIEGSWSSRVRLWPIDGHESTPSSLIGNSWEARVACLAAVADDAAGKLPPQAAGLVVEKLASPGPGPVRRVAGLSGVPGTPGVPGIRENLVLRVPGTPGPGPLVTAFGPNPYGEGTLLHCGNRRAMAAFLRFICPAECASRLRSRAICAASRAGRRSRFPPRVCSTPRFGRWPRQVSSFWQRHRRDRVAVAPFNQASLHFRTAVFKSCSVRILNHKRGSTIFIQYFGLINRT